MRSYCLPDRATLVPQDYSPAVKPTSSLEFLVLTISIEHYAHLPLLFQVVCIDEDCVQILCRILAFNYFIENRSWNNKRRRMIKVKQSEINIFLALRTQWFEIATALPLRNLFVWDGATFGEVISSRSCEEMHLEQRPRTELLGTWYVQAVSGLGDHFGNMFNYFGKTQDY